MISSQIDPNLAAYIHSRGRGQPLPQSVRNYFEPRFGYDFSQVRVHTDAQAAESARLANARAYTLGRDIVFGSGQYVPKTTAGQQLLAHELTHVVQNREAQSTSTIRRVCPPEVQRRGRTNTDPNEGQSAGVRQLGNPCVWILYGFHINNSEFKIAFTGVVNQLAGFLRVNSGAQLRLLGLNDCFGSDARNAAMGNARSLNVKNAFPSSLHSRINLLPSNGQRYLTSNDTPLNRSINRSVQIEVVPPSGTPCPGQRPLGRQLTPAIQAGCTGENREALATAARGAVPYAITALARVRNWRNNSQTQSLLDVYFRTTNDAQRQVAANRVAFWLDSIIPALQRPNLDCLEPEHPSYSTVCPNNTIADAAGGGGIIMPTFCMPQFTNLGAFGRTMTVIHELSHNAMLGGTTDYGAYYIANTCMPTATTVGLTYSQRLRHADSFSCFIGMVARLAPQ